MINNKTITLRDFGRKFYLENKKTYLQLADKQQDAIKIYGDICSVIINQILNHIYKGNSFKIPLRQGKFEIVKYKSKSKKIDWKNTKANGKYIYHLNLHSDGYLYRFRWNKSSAWLSNKTFYKFKATRYNTRFVASQINLNKLEVLEASDNLKKLINFK
jgi:hypothetical protein